MMRGYGFDYGPMMGGIGWWWQILIVLFWLLTGFYVRRARCDFDETKDEILREVLR